MAVAANGQLAATGSSDGLVQLWNVASGRIVGPPLSGLGGGIGAIAFSPHGKRLVSGSEDSAIRVWEVKNGRQSHSVLTSSSISFLTFSPDGRFIGVGNTSGRFQVFDAKSYQETGSFDCGEKVRSLVIAPDNSFVVVASGKDVLGTSLGIMPHDMSATGHTALVNTVACSSNGRFIASGADDATVRLWDAKSGDPCGPVFHGHAGPVISVSFSPTGLSVISVGSDGAIRVWDLDKSQSTTLRPRNLISPTTPYYANGWILTSSNQRMTWVPPAHREQFEGDGRQENVAAHHFILTSTSGDLRYGKDWTDCWKGSN